MSRPAKRRKTASQVEEITFDTEARADFLTGFHKRKQQRIKHAQDEAAKKDKEFRIEQRRQIREQRQKDLEAHVEAVNAMIQKPTLDDSDAGTDEDVAVPVQTELAGGDSNEDEAGREDEYIDEGKYTTVTIEPMTMSDTDDDSETEKHGKGHEGEARSTKRTWTKQKPSTGKPKKKRKKFRYETKVERKTARTKQKAKNSAAAKVRREANSRK